MSHKDLTNQEKLEEVYSMTLENNSILRSLRNQQRIANIMRAIYWVVIIAAFAGVFYYVSPIISMFISNADKINTTVDGIRQLLPETRAIDAVLNSVK
jgi:hypothetical protein